MRDYAINAKRIKNPIYKAPIKMGGVNHVGDEVSIGNYYLQYNQEPFFIACGEAHFSRMNEKLWEDEIIKMKLGGLNVIASYIFWIHHEEIEGQFDWSGNKNLRRFIELCKKNGMYVFLRIGPFSHGECRNGGFPDWLYGKPFDIRCNNPEYLAYTKRFYKEIYKNAEGLLFKDGGPVLGVQLENEMEHASCPWEMTTENSKEWVVSGREGVEHMTALKELAIEVGFDVPLYTGTAWGGACAPEQVVLPLWGGYAFRPWMFYDPNLKVHPATAEYLYGDFHNNSAPKYYNFDPEYNPEDLPYACCEMGGGMNVYYPYRFQLPYESVGALAQVKAGSGCNFLGYYMYHGGTHPTGKRLPYLNEGAVPKFSYDYQAPLGEFGQVRKSFHQLKLQHYFYKEFQKEFCATKTILSEESKTQIPEDVETLRYVVRMDEEGSGFLFINNYQDHVEGIDQKDFAVTIETDQGSRRIPSDGYASLSKEAYAILPINFTLDGMLLKYATAQLVTRVHHSDCTYYIFTRIEGMKTEFSFGSGVSVIAGEDCIVDGHMVHVGGNQSTSFEIRDQERKLCEVSILSVEDSMRLWQLGEGDERKLLLSSAPVVNKDTGIEIEYTVGDSLSLGIFPYEQDRLLLGGNEYKMSGISGIFKFFGSYREEAEMPFSYKDTSSQNSEKDGVLKRPVVGSPISSMKVVNARGILSFDEEVFKDYKQVFLSISYEGDIGYAFCDGEMFHDNFCNGVAWEIDLVPYKEKLLEKGMYIYVSPKKVGSFVDNSSAMAARFEIAEQQIAKINGVSMRGVKAVSVGFLG